MVRIAFLWVGDSIAVPEFLVRSARLVMGDGVDVVQLTDRSTPEVPGVSSVARFDLSPQIMVARLQAYAEIEPSQDFTFFCDADSLFISPLRIEETPHNILLSPRLVDAPINPHFPEFYPEFVGKTLSQVMPYLFGAMAVRRDHQFFTEMLEICQSLPERFQRWYGDQYALQQLLLQSRHSFGHLEVDRQLHVVRDPLGPQQLRRLVNERVQMITFKGPTSKVSIPATWNALRTMRQDVQP